MDINRLNRDNPGRNNRPPPKPPEGGGPEFKWQRSARTLLFWAVIFMAGLLLHQVLVGGKQDP
ncbi:MAG: hypothetical protein DRP26_07220, partial [Candidatus Zixiibacteriota bacterium]